MSITTRAYTATGSAAALVQSVNLGSTGDVPYVYDCSAPVDFGGSATGTIFNASSATTGVSAAQSCLGFKGVELKAEFANISGKVRLRIWLRDANATAGWRLHPALPSAGTLLNSIGVGSTVAAVLKSGYYHGESLSFDTLGAKEFMVEIVASGTSSNARSVWFGLR